jgi:hypothetical protein
MKQDLQIFNLIKQEEDRQTAGIELIASENYVSNQVLEALGSICTNKYAEGYPGARYYGGCEVVDQIEQVAIDRLCEIFEEGEIDGIYLNFSDPWPRKKQAKRRLTHRDFLARYDEVLCDEGFIFFKTDNTKLFEFSLNELAEYGLRMRNITFDLASCDIDNVVTEYEERFMEQGMNIYRVEAYK